MSLSFGKKLVYALGQFGCVLCAYGVGKLFLRFFAPGNADLFPAYLPQGSFFGMFTIAGLIVALSSLAYISSSLVSGWVSDKTCTLQGRRIPFLLSFAIPLSLVSAFIFYPPGVPGSTINAVYVSILTLFFFVSLSFYAVPYLALLAEVGQSPRDRLQLSVMLAFSTAFATLLGNRIYTLMDILVASTGMSALTAFRFVIFFFSAVSCACLLAPVLAISRDGLSDGEAITESFTTALSAVLGDKNFRSYVWAELFFRCAFATLMTGFSAHITVLLGLPKRASDLFLLLLFFSNLALYVPLFYFVRRYGKRKILFIAFILLVLALSAGSFAGKYPAGALVQGLILSILFSLSYAAFTAIPLALVADLSAANERKTGLSRAGVYFGLHACAVKGGEILAGLLFPLIIVASGSSLLDTPRRFSLRLTLVLGGISAILGFLALFGYREKEVMSVLERPAQ